MVKSMPYRWKTKTDVDEAVVVIMNVLDKNPDLPNWLILTLNGSIADSDKKLVGYFFEEVRKHAPSSLKYFESRE
jgi:hypothetical protein